MSEHSCSKEPEKYRADVVLFFLIAILQRSMVLSDLCYNSRVTFPLPLSPFFQNHLYAMQCARNVLEIRKIKRIYGFNKFSIYMEEIIGKEANKTCVLPVLPPSWKQPKFLTMVE